MQIDTRRLKAVIGSQDLTKSELARLSGVSRGTIGGMLREANKRVREGTVRKLAHVLNVAPEQITFGGVRTTYLEWLADQHENLDFHGLGTGPLPPMLLRDLYVPTMVNEDNSGDRDKCGYDDRTSMAEKTPEFPSEPMEFEQAVLRYDRMVMLGDPGSGKTTLLHHLAATSASPQQETRRKAEQVRLPMFVCLAQYSKTAGEKNGLDPVAFVAACARQDGRPDPEKMLRKELEQGKCVVLLDGLDEVPHGKQIDTLRGCLKGFIRRYPRNRFVITARRIGFDPTFWKRLGFVRLSVRSWKNDQIRDFVLKWFDANATGASARARADARERAEQLCSMIRENPRVRAIATNPLMLTILAVLHHGRGLLPRRRADLYSKVVDTLLETWETAKFSARPGDLLHGTLLEGREYAWLLGYLAFQMQQNDLTIAPRWWLVDHVQKFLHEELGLELEEAKSECDRVVRHLGERCGLLVERGRGFYAFWHLTFQEYFVSRAILQQAATQSNRSLVNILREYFYHPRWAEVVRLVASQLTPSQTPALLRSILDDPDPVGRFLHRGPLLALACLSDGAVVADAQLLDQIFSSVPDLGKSRWLGITMDALRVLQDFDETRFASRAGAAVEKLLRSAKEHLSRSEYCHLRKVDDKECRQRVAETLAKHSEGHLQLGESVTIDCEGESVTYYYSAPSLRADQPQEWYTRAQELLETEDTDEAFRVVLVCEIGEAILATPVARKIIKRLLSNSPYDEVRKACAQVLKQVAPDDPAIQAELVNSFQNDTSEAVRQACGASLRDVAVQDENVCKLLVRTLQSSETDGVRAGAAAGLRKVVRTAETVRRAVFQVASCEDEDEAVRVSCIWSLEHCLCEEESVINMFVKLVNDEQTSRLQRLASQVLGRALARGNIPWDRHLVERVERNLMQLSKPCTHALAALEQLVDAREIRAALRLERVLADCLEENEGDVEIAFVFGSMARLVQNMDSDIDLFVVGDVSLKQLSGSLDCAQTTFGRQINPVIYDRSTLAERYHTGNPFLRDVLRSEKIFIKGDENGLRDMVAVQPA